MKAVSVLFSIFWSSDFVPSGEVTSEALIFSHGRGREVNDFLDVFGWVSKSTQFKMTAAALLRRIQKDL